MGNLKEKLFGLIDSSASNAFNLINTVHEAIDSIDWDNQLKTFVSMKDSLVEKGNDFLKDFNELMKQVKETINDFEVSIPFDESEGEEFNYSIVDNKLVLEVKFKDNTSERLNRTTVIIPDNCDVEKLTTRYNNVAKVMSVIIPKVMMETLKDEGKDEKPSGYKLRKNVATPKKTVSKVEEEEHDAASKLLREFRKNVKKVTENTVTEELPRAANGRFVKRSK